MLNLSGILNPRKVFLTNQVKGASLRVKGASLRVEGASLRVEGASERVRGASLRVEGASMRVYTRFFANQKKFHFKPFFFVAP